MLYRIVNIKLQPDFSIGEQKVSLNMKENKRKDVRIIIIGLAVIAVVLNIIFFSRPRLETADYGVFPVSNASATPIPPEGVMATKEFSSVPGNPQFTLNQMQKIYSKILIYQKKEGCYPQSSGKSLMMDMITDFDKYGLRSLNEAREIYTNPDVWLTDDNAGKKPQANLLTDPYFYPSRPDGSSKCNPKVGPGRDILMMTDMYVHRNIRINRGDTTTSKPIGFYLVLWDDGKVEQIPWEKARFLKQETSYGATAVFDGQYGVDKMQTETFSEKEGIAVAGK